MFSRYKKEANFLKIRADLVVIKVVFSAKMTILKKHINKTTSAGKKYIKYEEINTE